MAEPTSVTAHYIAELMEGLPGTRRDRARLCTEVRSHIEDALQADDEQGAESRLIERLGTPQQIADDWILRCDARRIRQRKRGALVAALAISLLLGVAQHAQGGQASGGCEKTSLHQRATTPHHAASRTHCAR